MLFSYFFFQAEDGIRDYKVTGVQTCALPISRNESATACTLPCSASNRRGRYSISTSRSSKMNDETSCKAGRCGAPAGGAGVHGCRCLAKSHLAFRAVLSHAPHGRTAAPSRTHRDPPPALDKTENSIPGLRRNVQQNRKTGNAGREIVRGLHRQHSDPQAPMKGGSSRVGAIPKTFKHPLPPA